MADTDVRSGRELRLLMLVVVVAIAALLLLARFKFPEAAERTPVTPLPGPLDRLATRPSFQELASAISTLGERLAPSFVVVEIAEPIKAPPAPPSRPSTAKPSRGGRESSGRDALPEIATELPTRLAALRVSSDRALMYLPPGARVLSAGSLGTPEVVSDATRPLALVRVPAATTPNSLLATGLETFSGFAYVALIEGARGGATTRPIFVGRIDEGADPAWPDNVLFVGGNTAVDSGAIVFALDGRLIGMAIQQSNGVMIVPARVLTAVVNTLLGAKSGS